MTGYIGRYAPSPTGDLHLGNLLAAVAAWARARRARGRVLLRMEDLDTPRVVPGAAARIVCDLASLGLDFDAGPDRDDGRGPYVQSLCLPRYEAALDELRRAGRLFACTCSRKDLQRVASAPHQGDEGPPYPGTCRDAGHPFDDPGLPVSWRFVTEPGPEVIEDRLQGTFVQDVAREVGDFVVRRKDGIIAYHLAVVVDDARQGITEVVRGRDLLASAPRQAQLFRALGAKVPAFAHVPLWVGEDGERLAKRKGAGTVRAMLEQGVSPEALLCKVGRALGVCRQGEEITAARLQERLADDVLAVPTIRDDGPLREGAARL